MTRRIILVLAIGLGLAAPARAEDSATPAPASPAPAAAAAEKVTGPAAWDRLKGNTIEAKTGSDSFAEFFDPGGGVRYVDKDGLSKGTWAVKANKVCFDFPDDDDRSCSVFEVTGETGMATDDDGTVVRFKIVAGNSKGL